MYFGFLCLPNAQDCLESGNDQQHAGLVTAAALSRLGMCMLCKQGCPRTCNAQSASRLHPKPHPTLSLNAGPPCPGVAGAAPPLLCLLV